MVFLDFCLNSLNITNHRFYESLNTSVDCCSFVDWREPKALACLNNPIYFHGRVPNNIIATYCLFSMCFSFIYLFFGCPQFFPLMNNVTARCVYMCMAFGPTNGYPVPNSCMEVLSFPFSLWLQSAKVTCYALNVEPKLLGTTEYSFIQFTV